jgi:hypothetical protein
MIDQGVYLIVLTEVLICVSLINKVKHVLTLPGFLVKVTFKFMTYFSACLSLEDLYIFRV